MAKKTKPRSSCSICSYFSNRKWNLERHYEKVHNQMPAPQQKVPYWNQAASHKVPVVHNERSKSYSSSGDDWIQRIDELSRTQNRIANSKQTFDRANFLESRISTLENQLHQLYQHNWIIPREYIRGLSGHVCYLCKTFNFRPVIDPGYDLTMQIKHNCYNPTGGFTIPVPGEVQDVDRWSARILFEQMNYLESIGNRLHLIDITKKFKDFTKFEYSNLLLGIPHRHPFITLENEVMINLVDSVINSPENRILLLDSQILDLLSITKSTYGILKVPRSDDFKYYYMTIVK